MVQEFFLGDEHILKLTMVIVAHIYKDTKIHWIRYFKWVNCMLCELYLHSNGTPLQYFCLEKSHGRRSLVGCSPWGREESDTTERLHFHFSLSCIGEGNGNPLQCSCLENPRDGEAWWAAIYGVAQSRTRLKRLSSSSSSSTIKVMILYRAMSKYNYAQ